MACSGPVNGGGNLMALNSIVRTRPQCRPALTLRRIGVISESSLPQLPRNPKHQTQTEYSGGYEHAITGQYSTESATYTQPKTISNSKKPATTGFPRMWCRMYSSTWEFFEMQCTPPKASGHTDQQQGARPGCEAGRVRGWMVAGWMVIDERRVTNGSHTPPPPAPYGC